MKGVPGLLIAAGLGIAGAVCNWFYVQRLAGDYEKISFIGIDTAAQLNVGDRFREDQLVRIDVPRAHAGDLATVAPLWEIRSTIIGQPTNRAFTGGELVLQQDILTPAQRDLNKLIGQNERILWLPIDPRTFNTSRVNPGDEVSFLVPQFLGSTPPVDPSTGERASANEIVGPFRILALGDRMGRPEIQQASGSRRSSAESTLAISVKLENGRLEPSAERITEVLRLTKFQGVQVLLHPAKN